MDSLRAFLSSASLEGQPIQSITDEKQEILADPRKMNKFFEKIESDPKWVQTQAQSNQSMTNRLISAILEDQHHFQYLPRLVKAAQANEVFRSMCIRQGRNYSQSKKQLLEKLKEAEGGELIRLEILLSNPLEFHKQPSEIVNYVNTADLNGIPLDALYKLMIHGLQNQHFDAVAALFSKMIDKKGITPYTLLPNAIEYCYSLGESPHRAQFFKVIDQIILRPELFGPHKKDFQFLNEAVLRKDYTMIVTLIFAGMDPNLKDGSGKNCLARLKETLPPLSSMTEKDQTDLKNLIQILISSGIHLHELDSSWLAFAYQHPREIPDQKLFTVKDFALLAGDAFIREMRLSNGQRLEGGNFVLTIPMLLKLVKEVQSSPGLEAINPSNLKGIEEKLTQAYNLAYYYSPQQSTAFSPESLAQAISRDLAELPVGHSCLVPSGYLDQNKGHAMLCEFTKQADQSFTIKIINTGDGIQYHPAIPGELKQKISPYLCYENVSLEELENTKLLTALAEMKVRYPPQTEGRYTSHDIYRAALKSLERKMNPNPPDDLTEFITKQHSGTCSVRCLMAYMRMKLGQKQYKILKHHIEAAAALKTLDINREVIRSDPIAAEVMRRSAENIARQGIKLDRQKIPIPASCSAIPKHVIEEVNKLTAQSKASPTALNFQAIPAEFRVQGESIVANFQNELQDVFKGIAEEVPGAPSGGKINRPIPYLPTATLTAPMLTQYLDDVILFIKDSLLGYDDKRIARQLMIHKAMDLPLPEPIGKKDIWDDIPSELLHDHLKKIQAMLNYLASEEKPAPSYATLTAMHKLYAISWKLVCRLDAEDTQKPPGFPSLRDYQNDLTVLENLASTPEDISLEPSYRQEILKIIGFFKASAPRTKAKTLFKCQDWRLVQERDSENYGKTRMLLTFPLPKDSADYAYVSALAKRYSRDEIEPLIQEYKEKLPAEARENIPLEQWINSKVWLEPLGNKVSPFHLIRDMAITCRAFMGTDHESCIAKGPSIECLNDRPPIMLTEMTVSKSLNSYQLVAGVKTDYGREVGDLQSLQTVSLLKKYWSEHALPRRPSQKAPDILRQAAHPGISYESAFYKALESSQEENQFIAEQKYRQMHGLFKNISELQSISWDPRIQSDHLAQYYRHHIAKLLDPDERTFFLLCLFNKGVPDSNLKDHPDLAKALFEVLDKGIEDFSQMLSGTISDAKISDTSSKASNAPSAFLSLLLAKAKLLKILSDQKADRALIAKERASLVSLMGRIREGTHAFDVFKDPVLANMLNTVDILVHDLEPSWDDPGFACEVLSLQAQNALTTPNELSRIDCLYPQTCAQVLLKRVKELEQALKSPSAVASLIQQIFKANGFSIDPQKIQWKSDFKTMAFPWYEFTIEGKSFKVNAMTGGLWQDGVDLHAWLRIVHEKEFQDNFKNKTFSNIKGTLLKDHGDGKVEILYAANDGQKDYRFIVLNDGEGGQSIDKIEKQIGDKIYYLNRDVPHDYCLPLEKRPILENYLFWSDPTTKTVVVEDKTTGQDVLTLSKTIKEGSDQTEWSWIDFDPNDKSFEQLFHFDSRKAIIGLGRGDQSRLIFANYRSLSGQILQFEMRNTAKHGEPVMRMVWKENPHYFIAPEQWINGGNRRYLLLETRKGERKALIPIQTYAEMKNKDAKLEDLHTCALVNVDKSGNLAPADSKEHLLLAHHYLAQGLYDNAWKEIRMSRSLSPYSDEEFQLLGRIMMQDEESSDYRPEAEAIRVLASWLAHDNIKRFPEHFSNISRLSQGLKDSNKEVNMYSRPENFTGYFLSLGKWGGLLSFKEAAASHYADYLEVCQNLPPSFHVEHQIGNAGESGFLTSFEEAAWLNSLTGGKADKRDLLGDRRLALQNQLEVRPFLLRPPKPSENPIESNHKLPYTEPSLMPPQTIPPFTEVLAQIPRIRPQRAIYHHFSTLFHYAANGTPEQKKQILELLNDCRYEFLEKTELLKYALGIICRINPDTPKDDFKRVILEDFAKLAKASNSYQKNTIKMNLERDLNAHRKAVLTNLGAGDIQIRDLPTGLETLLPPLASSKPSRMPFNIAFKETDNLNSELFTRFFIRKKTAYKDEYERKQIPKELEVDHYAEKKAASLADWKTGRELNGQDQQIEMISESDLGALDQEVQTRIDYLNEQKSIKLGDLERLIKILPADENARKIAELQILGKAYQHPSVEECIGLFVQGDMEKYQRRLPYLTREEISKLHNEIGLYLSLATVLQRFQRAKGHLVKAAKAKKGHNPLKWQKSVRLAGQELANTRAYNLSQRPSFLAFEHAANVNLRPEQCRAIEKMLATDKNGKYPDVILQMIMAAGKTFVLGTLMALEKADGYHLSILIPPAALFDTNVQDMQRRSEAFFGQRAHTILFNRSEKQFSVEYLRQIKFTLLQAIQNREYIMMPPETLQSMQNKYIEALDQIATLQDQARAGLSVRKNIDEEIQAWEASTRELKSILEIIRTRGVATFDEVDTIYNPRKELNYPTMDKTAVDFGSTLLIAELLHVIGTEPAIRRMGLDIQNNKQAEMVPDAYQKMIPSLADLFVKRVCQKTDLARYLGMEPADLQKKDKVEALRLFLASPQKEVPSWLAELKSRSPSSAERIILLKREIHEWLPKAFLRSVDEHFGRSNDPSYEFARPNLAAKTPNEKSEFADRWDLLNKTLLVYMHNGLGNPQIKTLIARLVDQAISERRSTGDAIRLDETPAALNFKEATGLNLFEIDPEMEDSLNRIGAALKGENPQAKRLVLDYLAYQVFAQWQIHTKQIFSNSLDLGAMVKTVQGYSGTMDHPYIFPDSCQANIQLDVGTNGRVIDVLCRRNKTVHLIDRAELTAEQFLERLLKDRPREEVKKMHALIDIGAYFKGYPNDAVAQSILSYFSKDPSSNIQGVLYYDPHSNKLAFIRKGMEDKPVLLPGTDSATIRRITGLKPYQLFTFYDQNHTTGSDIAQAPDAAALATVGANDTLRNILQGSMRMRQLFLDQHIEFVVPATLLPLMETRIGKTGKLDVQDILNFAEVNSCLNENEDGLRVCLQKMENAARGFIIGQLIAQPTSEREQAIYSKASSLFLRDLDKPLFERFQRPSKLADSSEVLKDFARQYIEILEGCRGMVDAKELQAVKDKLTQIAAVGVRHVPSRLEVSTVENVNLEATVENEKEAEKQKEIQAEKQVERQQDIDIYTGPYHIPAAAAEKPWPLKSPLTGRLLEPVAFPNSVNNQVAVWSLNNVLQTLKTGASDRKTVVGELFSDHIHVTENFARTIEGQWNILDNYQKPIHEALLIRDAKTNQLRLIFLSIAEAADWKQFLNQNASKIAPLQIALIQPDGRIVERGTLSDLEKELEDLNSPARNLLVQALVLNGHVKELMSPKWRPALENWLKTHRAIKRDLFEMVVMHADELPYYAESEIKKLFNLQDPDENPKHSLHVIAGPIPYGHSDRIHRIVLDILANPAMVDDPQVIEDCFRIGVNFLSAKWGPSKNQQYGMDILDKLLPYVKDTKSDVIKNALAGFLMDPTNRNQAVYPYAAQYLSRMELKDRRIERDVFKSVLDSLSIAIIDEFDRSSYQIEIQILFLLSDLPANRDELNMFFENLNNPKYLGIFNTSFSHEEPIKFPHAGKLETDLCSLIMEWKGSHSSLLPLALPFLRNLIKSGLERMPRERLEKLKLSIVQGIDEGKPSNYFSEIEQLERLSQIRQLGDPLINQLIFNRIISPLLEDLKRSDTSNESFKLEILKSYEDQFKPAESLPSSQKSEERAPQQPGIIKVISHLENERLSIRDTAGNELSDYHALLGSVQGDRIACNIAEEKLAFCRWVEEKLKDMEKAPDTVKAMFRRYLKETILPDKENMANESKDIQELWTRYSSDALTEDQKQELLDQLTALFIKDAKKTKDFVYRLYHYDDQSVEKLAALADMHGRTVMLFKGSDLNPSIVNPADITQPIVQLWQDDKTGRYYSAEITRM